MKKIYLALILFLLVMVVGCGKETEQKKNPYFQATVLEVKENSILVEPFEGEQELTSVDRISVSTDVISIQEVPEMEEGTEGRRMRPAVVPAPAPVPGAVQVSPVAMRTAATPTRG